MTAERVAMIRERLTAALQPEDLEIQDDSARHAGHEGAKGGGGHFNVRIVSPAFAGRNLLERHRMVYDALGDAMHSEIHALSIQAKTPEEL
ncbi:BolA family transcriptional regulator [Thiohalobacter sp. COW1]|uniref:BolA family protein n=1 Tax=Thiohalobacter sp. COW1 TaxID=2795687 RepID=UPI0019168A0B|nr:BolA family protein [Thiohalobacter sp. COW1]BCO30328.1 BolA family transcriptional regulator [Thiohalobacter sp. COW1]HSH28945.1 BolA family protein [Thiohalobacter sp.]